jgi:hypothetical protein
MTSYARRQPRGHSGLDGWGECGCISLMKAKISVILLGAVIAGAGCISTVNDRSTAGVPFIKDRVEGRYQRSVEQVFEASKRVITANGVMINESTLYSQTNLVKTVEGKVNQVSVWVRVVGIEPNTTQVTVQTRTSGGGADLDLAHEIEKQIALRLAH